MHFVEVREGVRLAYEDDWLGPPWADPAATAMLLHGMAESSQAWVEWVPVLGRGVRLIRPDLVGFGSSPVPENYGWTPDEHAADLVRLLDSLRIEHVHLVGERFGGVVAMSLASRYPDRVRSLSVFGSPVSIPARSADAMQQMVQHLHTVGMRGWAAERERERLGSAAPEAQVRWWADQLMGKTDERAFIGVQMAMDKWKVEEGLPNIKAPTVIVSTEGNTLFSVDSIRDYQETIPNSRLEILPGDAYHPAAVYVEDCASIVRRQIAKTEPNNSTGS